MDSSAYSRSPELMSARDTALLVVDVQSRLIGIIPEQARLIWNIRRLIDGAGVLNLPVLATEQYPQGLGQTVPQLAERITGITEKQTFSCCGAPSGLDELESRDVFRVLVVGIEAHVCVQQTVLDLLAAGFRVYVAVDAVGSRFDVDFTTALRRMEVSGAVLTTTEAALFEWCERAGTPEFKQISQLVKETPPE